MSFQTFRQAFAGIAGAESVEQRHRPCRLDQPVEPLERVHTIHPMKRAAHDNQVEMAQCRVEVIGAAGDEADVCRLPGQRAGLSEHLGRGINRYHFADERSEVAGERARATTKIEHAVLRSQGR